MFLYVTLLISYFIYFKIVLLYGVTGSDYMINKKLDSLAPTGNAKFFENYHDYFENALIDKEENDLKYKNKTLKITEDSDCSHSGNCIAVWNRICRCFGKYRVLDEIL